MKVTNALSFEYMQYGWMQPMKKAYLNTDFMKKYWWKMFDDIIRLSDFGGKKDYHRKKSIWT